MTLMCQKIVFYYILLQNVHKKRMKKRKYK
jgi:hypothetical protein